MEGLMQDRPLVLPHLFDRAERLFPKKEVVTATAYGTGACHLRRLGGERTRQLGGVLDAPGNLVERTGRPPSRGTPHVTSSCGSPRPASGRVLHTLNIRLFPEQLTYIVNHAEDEVIFVDKSLLGVLWPLVETFDTVKHIVVMDDGRGELPEAGSGPELLEYEALLGRGAPVEWQVDDENRAASMCYTSGTTGNPKGVVYSHRSTWLHTMSTLMADGLGVSEHDRILPVVPMFHANAWGLAHAGVATGASLVMPGPDLSAPAIAALIEEEHVTMAAGVPTIWMGVLPELKGRDLSALRFVACGGSAVPKALSEAFREQIGLPISQAWGMTETSPLASIPQIKSYLDDTLDDDAKADIRASVGLVSFGVDFRVVDPMSLEDHAVGRREPG